MQSHVRVAIIGGGVVGCSLLYHLAKRGCKDAVLLERSELTSGSSWHAAGGTHVMHDVKNISRMHRYTMSLYETLEEETGQSCGLHKVGGIYVAFTPERLNQFKVQKSKARYLGIDFEFISLNEAKEMNPLLNLEDCLGAMYEPNEWHLDPSGVTQAFAKGARMAGGEIIRFCPVLETNPLDDGSWEVVTEQGTLRADTLVNAAGLWAREVAALAGVRLPLQPLEHQYFVTEPIPELEALGREIPLLHDNDGGYYLRQEGKGLLLGAYERNGKFWAESGTPLDFGHELLPDDLERIEEYMLRAIKVTPCLETAGVKRVVNGPMIWTPDTVALAGPIPELRNYFVATGMIPGFSQSGGLGKALADWIL
ncbi:MAG: FAD-binding oxidoreductase, partial [Proteobacteria bacterium]|nr:FAD-binding oxidoreductase [Pseudomonadota bacterium]